MTRLYVVDDDRGFLDLVAEVAAPMGFDTVVTTTPKKFQSLYAGEADAVVMIDMVMPETDGIELLNWLIRSGPPGALIFVSGFAEHYTSMASALAEAKGLKVAGKLAKPVKLARMRDALATARDMSAARS